MTVTNIVLDHVRGATLTLQHLRDLCHEKIAFMKGAAVRIDSEDRWNAIREVASRSGIRMRPELTIQLEGDDPTPKWGYPFAQQLLACKQPFTALFAYNDISAMQPAILVTTPVCLKSQQASSLQTCSGISLPVISRA
jgi:DNA-binding LacI/PurR family transcriptional regulator